MFDWLTAPQEQLRSEKALLALKNKVRSQAFSNIVLLGMGGSSIGPRVFQAILAPASTGNFYIVDTIHPSAIRRLEDTIDLAHTLFIVASKSGSTLEPQVLYRYFWHRLEELHIASPARHFMAITDPISPLEQESVESGFLQGPFGHPGIGGRYSALSAFGLMPALLMDIDIQRLLFGAQAMASACGAHIKAEQNPGAELGVFLAINAQSGRDQLVFHFSKSLEPFGWWLEQLIAESLGKKNSGIVPIIGSVKGMKAGAAMHCYIELSDEKLPIVPSKASHYRIEIADTYDLGGEMFRWQIAVSIAGALLGLNPFDQPDVEKSKKSARAILENKMIKPKPSFESAGLIIYDHQASQEAVNIIAKFLSEAADSAYGVVLSYLDQTEANLSLLKNLSDHLTRKLSVPVLLQMGPRYLHSTGQLFKGGKNQEYFILITGPYEIDLPSFYPGVGIKDIHLSQALGDAQTLAEGGRKILHIHLKDIAVGFKELLALVKQA